MKPTLAFDVYGTLIDTSRVYALLEHFIGTDAKAFMEVWRTKQLEYSFRRGLMNTFVDFSVVSREALNYCCPLFNKPLQAEQIQMLMNAYIMLLSFNDVEGALKNMSKETYAICAFSNKIATAVSTLWSTLLIINWLYVAFNFRTTVIL